MAEYIIAEYEYDSLALNKRLCKKNHKDSLAWDIQNMCKAVFDEDRADSEKLKEVERILKNRLMW